MKQSEQSAQQALPSVWTRPERRRRDQPALSREQIVATALELLDSEGIDALSMRKLGARLGAGAASLYTHVANKDELIELAVDEVYGEVELPEAGGAADGEWRAAAAQCAHGLRAAFLRHPWIASVLGEAGLSHLGPNMLRMSEAMLGVFEDAGFPLEEADQAVNTLSAYVIGAATSEAAWLTLLTRSGRSEQEWVEHLWPAAERAVEPYPRLRRLYATRRAQDAEGARGDAFGTGLDSVLDGLATRLRG
ncbi:MULTISPECIES: TetR/AcrR family transcriptional regulator [Streptomyces]|uniref:TetR/AcrR family transcriptional regulator C-terminal domain-containing protein n=1 Tax=Streptomyces luteosporeus TaxID=173856 RepID=A0ABN3TJA1_9ACTN